MNHQAPGASDQDYSPVYKRFVLVMLTIVYAFNFVDRQILVILQEPIKAEMGLSDAQLGLLSGFTFAIVYVTAGIPIAYWADRGNRRNIVSLSLAVWSGMTAISGLVGNYFQLLLARIGVGLGEAGGSPPAHSMISDYYPPENRGTALSFYSSGIYIGILLGYLFGGMIAEAFGWRMAFLVVGLPGVVFAVILRLTVKEPLRGRWETAAAREAPKPSLRETLALLRDRPSFWYLALGAAAVSYVSYGNGNFFPSYLIRIHGLTIAEVGMVLALVSGLTGVIGTFLGGYLSDKFASRDMRWYMWIPMIGVGLSYIPYCYIVMSDNTTVALTVLFFAFILKTLYLGPCIAIAHTLVPPGMRAITSAVLFFILNMIGLGLGPFLTGLVSDLLKPLYADQSLRYSMLITTQVSVVAIALFYMAAKHLPSDLQKSGVGSSLSARST